MERIDVSPIFKAINGKEFNSAEDCLRWENAILKMKEFINNELFDIDAVYKEAEAGIYTYPPKYFGYSKLFGEVFSEEYGALLSIYDEKRKERESEKESDDL